jgi:3-deoxy-D-manno-octulosonic-acid transferase
MTLFLYDIVQPFGLLLFRFVVFVLKLLNLEKGTKLIQTLEIRHIDGRPAFEAVSVEKFHGKQPIWIHAASGEFEYAKPVIRALKDKGVPVFVTYFSPTYKENVASFPGVVASCPLPLENRSELRHMIGKVKPAALLIARTDTWPNMVRESYAAKVPVLLFSATFHEGSRRIGILARSLTKATYNYIEEIQCVNTEDLRVLSNFGYRRAVVRGDTRYDQVLARLDQSLDSAGKKLPEVLGHSLYSLVVVAGSVWDEDVHALVPAIELAKKTLGHGQVSCVFVPHEISPRLIGLIKNQADSAGLTVGILSELERKTAGERRFDVLIVDRVGILAELYLIGQFAFVGGSFRKTVHSVMEPLAAGCLTFVGPLHRNNREAIEFQSETAFRDWTSVTAAINAKGFGAKLSSTLKDFSELDEANRQSIRDRIREQIRSRGKATDAVIDWVRHVRS